MLFCSTHRPATDYGDLPLDGFSQTLERDDMSWFYNEYSDVVLTRTSIRLLLNQRPRAQSSTRERMNQSCEPPGFGGEGRIVSLPMKTGGPPQMSLPYAVLLPTMGFESGLMLAFFKQDDKFAPL